MRRIDYSPPDDIIVWLEPVAPPRGATPSKAPSETLARNSRSIPLTQLADVRRSGRLISSRSVTRRATRVSLLLRPTSATVTLPPLGRRKRPGS